MLDAGAGAGAGAVGLCRGGVPAGEGHRPRPYFCHSGRQANRPPLPLRLSALLVLALTALGGGGLAAAALLALWRYDFVAKKQFGGITGDLAGWFLQRAELWMLAALAVSQWGGVL